MRGRGPWNTRTTRKGRGGWETGGKGQATEIAAWIKRAQDGGAGWLNRWSVCGPGDENQAQDDEASRAEDCRARENQAQDAV